MVHIECLTSHPVPDGHLAKFLQTVKDTQTFQGIVLRGSLEGKAKQGGIMTGSLQCEIETAVNLLTKGLRERFDILLHETEHSPSNKAPTYGPREVV